MKIAFFEVREKEQEILTELLDGHNLSFYADRLNKDTIQNAQDAEIVSVFINSEIRKDIIDSLPNTKLIATRSTGFDHIDCVYAKEKNIAVATVPSYGAHTVAEFTFAHILNLSRKIYPALNQIRSTGDFNIMPFKGFDLYGKTLGVVGTGRIGKNVILIAKGFGMKIIASDLFPDKVFADANGVEYVPLPTLLANADVVTMHAPYTKETHHIINRENIKSIKQGALFVNTARGELVETEGLIDMLKGGIIAGAGLDVLEGERKLKEEKKFTEKGDLTEDDKKFLTLNHELINMPNVFVTPHIAFFSNEAEREILKTTADNISAFASEKPVNLIK